MKVSTFVVFVSLVSATSFCLFYYYSNSITQDFSNIQTAPTSSDFTDQEKLLIEALNRSIFKDQINYELWSGNTTIWYDQSFGDLVDAWAFGAIFQEILDYKIAIVIRNNLDITDSLNHDIDLFDVKNQMLKKLSPNLRQSHRLIYLSRENDDYHYFQLDLFYSYLIHLSSNNKHELILTHRSFLYNNHEYFSEITGGFDKTYTKSYNLDDEIVTLRMIYFGDD